MIMSCCSHRRLFHNSSRIVRCITRNYSFKRILRVSKEVSEAVEHGRAVVALESTIITHGMPYPSNLETAMAVEAICRDKGVVPATVAILKGQLCVGLNLAELENLAAMQSNVIKTSRRDLAYVLSQGLSGGTTVAGTMMAAHMVGVDVFVTGGLGGVHRDVDKSMDISADLTELAHTPVIVVCAGIKSVLDVGRTLEYLETQGVPVINFGDSREFPSFFTRQSGHQSPYNLQDASEVAKLIVVNKSLGLRNGVLLAVPIPEEHAMDKSSIEEAITLALQQAKQRGIHGKEVTPFLLKKVNELMGGTSLSANIALIKNNAKVGCEVAVAVAKLHRNNHHSSVPEKTGIVMSSMNKGRSHVTPISPQPIEPVHCVTSSSSHVGATRNGRVVVVGGINFDIISAFHESENNMQMTGSTYRGQVRQLFGGVGRNVSDCLSRLNCVPLFISAVGDDLIGEMFYLKHPHMDLHGVHAVPNLSTAVYSAQLSSSRELLFGVGDFAIHQEITPDYILKYKEEIQMADLVCMDGNIPAASMDVLSDICHQHKVPIWFEPTDASHVSKLFASSSWQRLTYASPNLNELRALNAEICQVDIHNSTGLPTDSSLNDVLKECIHLCNPIVQYIPNLFITLGKNGLLVIRSTDSNQSFQLEGSFQQVGGTARAQHFPVISVNQQEQQLVSVSGAGDCLAATIIVGVLSGESPEVSIQSGLLAASLSLASFDPVPSSITSCTVKPTTVYNKQSIVLI